jgi:hypothetical protein
MATQIHSKSTSTPQSPYDWPGSIEAVAAVISVLSVLTHDHGTGGCQAWI